MAAATPSSSSSTLDNNEQLRHRANRRLLGAALLLLAAIIAVPIFLERDPPPLSDFVDVRIPATEPRTAPQANLPSANAPRSGIRPAERTESDPVDTASPSASSEPIHASGRPQIATATALATNPRRATPEVEKKSNPDRELSRRVEVPVGNVTEQALPPAPATLRVARKSGQLVVQLAAVRDAATAKELADRVKALKIPVYTEKITVEHGVVTRVRVGPYETKQQAESARARLAQQGFEAKIFTLQ